MIFVNISKGSSRFERRMLKTPNAKLKHQQRLSGPLYVVELGGRRITKSTHAQMRRCVNFTGVEGFVVQIENSYFNDKLGTCLLIII